MSASRHQQDEALLHRLTTFKQSRKDPAALIGPELLHLNDEVQKRNKKMGKVTDVWLQLVPEHFNDHCTLEAFNRGTLTVAVDSSAHLYELKQLLLSGIEKQLLLACKGAGLRKINLKLGQSFRD